MTEYRWQKSSFSEHDGNNCVEIAVVGSGIALRESDEPGRVIQADPVAFRALTGWIKAGRWGAPGR
ncbi:DUF397 domain-containing protein [Streptomyces xiamenensis]|jgi:hypothetical protein|uniref:DUF397 domain-containing protein n=1 Tax=Streptomyces xiamenensis TaxID=408015 RepID=UPI003685717D